MNTSASPDREGRLPPAVAARVDDLSRGALARSPLEVRALAGHVAGRFEVAPARGFDVNPVTWHVLAGHGIAVRGPEPGRLNIRGDPAELRMWVRGNLDGYWRDWVAREWRVVIEDALAFWRGGRPARGWSRRHPMWRTRRAADYVAHVIDAGLGVQDSANPE